MSPTKTKLLIIGSGPAGYTAAVYPAGPEPIIKSLVFFGDILSSNLFNTLQTNY